MYDGLVSEIIRGIGSILSEKIPGRPDDGIKGTSNREREYFLCLTTYIATTTRKISKGLFRPVHVVKIPNFSLLDKVTDCIHFLAG